MTSRLSRLVNLAAVLSISFSILAPIPAHAGVSVGSGFCTSYVGSLTGVTPSTNGSYCILKFVTTSNLTTLSTTWTAPPGVSQLRILAVGGGGGGGNDAGGGGGGGQVVDTATVNISFGNTYAIAAGGGGDHGDGTWGLGGTNTGGVTGSTSSFGSTMVVAKGGSGAVGRSDRKSGMATASGWDSNGFTGGGGGLSVAGSTGTGGSSYAGGSAAGNANGVGAGGGGAGGAGTSTSNANGGAGGAGVTSNITGASLCYGGGGGGSSNSGTVGSATCGGHAGGTAASPSAGVADIGFGGGGGGGGGSATLSGGQGGAGVIILSWLPAQSLSFTTSTSTPFIYRTNESIVVSTQGATGKVTFKLGKVRIPGCISMSSNASNNFTVTCNWKPSQRGSTQLFVTLIPTGSIYSTTTTSYGPFFISTRANNR